MANYVIDRLDKKILRLISQDARMPFLEVARECNVSGAAIHQRVQKLRKAGVVSGSEFIINTYKIGFQTCAYIGITLNNINAFQYVVEELKKIPEVVECHASTGKYSMFIKVYAKDNRHLLQIILDRLTSIEGVAQTETFQISLDQVFKRQLAAFDLNEEEAKTSENEEEGEE